MDSHKQTTVHSTKNIRLAFILNLFFTLIEIIGGLWTNSLAIISDALHDLGDSISLGLAWYLERVSQKQRTKKFTYGYKRFSLLAALISSIILIIGSIIILTKAFPRIIDPEQTNAQGMILLAIVGIIINGIAVLRTRKGKTMNERIVTWHLFEDVLGWVAILIVSLLILVGNFYILDPILSLLIALFIVWNVTKNLKKTVKLFLQGVPESISIDDIEKQIRRIPGIVSVHDTHVWSLDGERNIFTIHLVVSNKCPEEEIFTIKCKARNLIARFNIQHSTIEIEQEGEVCKLKNC